MHDKNKCCCHTHAKYLAKRVEGIPFLLNLLAYSEIIGCEKTKENYFFFFLKGFSQPGYICIVSRSEEG